MQGLRVLDLSDNWKMEILPDSVSDLVNLRALQLRNCSNLMSLPSLSKLHLLRLLDLRGNDNLKSFPDSVSDLTNLVTLRLSRCRKLKWIPPVFKLQSLRTMELDDTDIEELPQGMEMLVNLTLLNLKTSDFAYKDTTPLGLLSSLCSLQFLSLEFVDLRTLNAMRSCRGLVEDLLSLKHLESLAITFPSLSDWVNYFGSPNYKGLKKFRIVIGDFRGMEDVISCWDPDFDNKSSIMSFIVLNPVDVPYSVDFLPRNTVHFHIEGFNDMKSLYDLRCLKDVRQLRECTITRCDNFEYIKHEDEDACSLLQSLEILEINNCPKLHSVYKGNFSTIHCLTTLTISRCHNLKNIFSSPRLLQQLQNLTNLNISFCDQLEEMIKSETTEELRESTNIITLPKLMSIVVWILPSLKKIWRGEMVCDSLRFFEIKDCPKLKRIPTVGEKQILPRLLCHIRGSTEWWNSLEWDSPFTKTLFQPYFVAFDNESEAYESTSDEESEEYASE